MARKVHSLSQVVISLWWTMSQVSLSPKRTAETSNVDLAYEEILRRIVGGELRVGTPIKSAGFAKELGTSRTPVMQAIAMLCSEGLLTQQPNYRAVVAEGAENWLISLHEVRLLLEPVAAHQAAGAMPQAKLQALDSLVQCFENAKPAAQREAAFQLDHELHTSIADAVGNLMIRSIIHKCMSYKKFAYRVPNDPPARLQRAHREHLEILNALRRGDKEMAAAAMRFHLQSTIRDLPDRHVV